MHESNWIRYERSGDRSSATTKKEIQVFKRLRCWLVRQRNLPESCNHEWHLVIEHYPVYAWNRWMCKTCGIVQNFRDSKSPIPVKLEICNMGHVHTVEAVTEETWPEVIYYRNEG